MSGDHNVSLTFEGKDRGYKATLLFVIALNMIMFIVEMTAGFAASSQALKADALDFLADSLTYAVTLAVIGKSLRVRAFAALTKGASLALIGLGVFGTTVYRAFVGGAPNEYTMGLVGFLALAANAISVLALWRYKDGDSNVRSVWLCSRNDAIGNVVVIVAALAVGATKSHWPDVIVAFVMATLFFQSAVLIVRQARAELKGSHHHDHD